MRDLPRSMGLALVAAVMLFAFNTPAAAEELIVSAAGSLTRILPVIGKAFEARHPGVKVLYNFGASGNLLQQIAAGAPVDVFISADEATMDEGVKKGLIAAATRRAMVGNRVVVIVPSGSTLGLHDLQSLNQPAVKRIAFGNKAMPNARYSETALKAAGVWDTLKPRFILCATVVQAVNYVAQGDVDAGFVFATDAATAPGKVKVAFTVPVREPIVYPAAAVARAPHPSLAAAFVTYLLSPQAQRVFHQYGFMPPEAATQ